MGYRKRILVFAGTFEGHQLAEAFAAKGWQDRADFCVATEYGSQTLQDIQGISIMEGRLDLGQMEKLLCQYGMVIDATHPYAKAVTENIQAACQKAKVQYLRLLRRESEIPEGVMSVSSAEEAAELINRRGGKVLLTTGAKELSKYSSIGGIEERIVARVLPSRESIESCLLAGISQKNIIAMQGPFTAEMNLATMRQYGCTCLVTKNTGKPGGFDDKLSLLLEGYEIIVIERPSEETGISFEEVMRKAEAFYG